MARNPDQEPVDTSSLQIITEETLRLSSLGPEGSKYPRLHSPRIFLFGRNDVRSVESALYEIRPEDAEIVALMSLAYLKFEFRGTKHLVNVQRREHLQPGPDRRITYDHVWESCGPGNGENQILFAAQVAIVGNPYLSTDEALVEKVNQLLPFLSRAFPITKADAQRMASDETSLILQFPKNLEFARLYAELSKRTDLSREEMFAILQGEIAK